MCLNQNGVAKIFCFFILFLLVKLFKTLSQTLGLVILIICIKKKLYFYIDLNEKSYFEIRQTRQSHWTFSWCNDSWFMIDKLWSKIVYVFYRKTYHNCRSLMISSLRFNRYISWYSTNSQKCRKSRREMPKYYDMRHRFAEAKRRCLIFDENYTKLVVKA